MPMMNGRTLGDGAGGLGFVLLLHVLLVRHEHGVGGHEQQRRDGHQDRRDGEQRPNAAPLQ